MQPNPSISALRSLVGKGNPLACMIALAILGPLPVSNDAVELATDQDDEATARGLKTLEMLGLVQNMPAGRRNGWKLTDKAWQLPLPIHRLSTDDSALVPLQAVVPSATSAQDPRENGGSPATIPGPEIPDSRGSSSCLSNKDSINESITTTTTHKSSPEKTDSNGRHLAEISRALLVRGLPRPVDDDYLPADLRLCAERLAKIGVPRKRAELAAARSPFSAELILSEISKWEAHAETRAGRGITNLPMLIAARIESGERCPFEPAQGQDDPWNGYREFMSNTRKE